MADYVYHDTGKRFNCLLWDVETAAFSFAIIAGIWDVVNLIFFQFRYVSVLTAIDLVAWIGIVFASIKQMPQLYLPALIVNLIYIVVHMIFTVMLLAAAFFLGVDKQMDVGGLLSHYTGYDITLSVSNSMFAWLMMWSLCFFVSSLILVAVEEVVHRAYIKMREENHRHHIPIAALHTGSENPLISLDSASPQVNASTIYC